MPILEEHDQEKRVGLLLVTGDRGLAGPFNSQIIRAGNRRARRTRGGTARRSSGSRRGAAASPRSQFRGHDVSGSYVGFTDRPVYSNAREIADDLVQHYIDNELDRVEIIYNHYVSAMTQDCLARDAPAAPADSDVLTEGEGEVRTRGRTRTRSGREGLLALRAGARGDPSTADPRLRRDQASTELCSNRPRLSTAPA